MTFLIVLAVIVAMPLLVGLGWAVIEGGRWASTNATRTIDIAQLWRAHRRETKSVWSQRKLRDAATALILLTAFPVALALWQHGASLRDIVRWEFVSPWALGIIFVAGYLTRFFQDEVTAYTLFGVSVSHTPRRGVMNLLLWLWLLLPFAVVFVPRLFNWPVPRAALFGASFLAGYAVMTVQREIKRDVVRRLRNFWRIVHLRGETSERLAERAPTLVELLGFILRAAFSAEHRATLKEVFVIRRLVDSYCMGDFERCRSIGEWVLSRPDPVGIAVRLTAMSESHLDNRDDAVALLDKYTGVFRKAGASASYHLANTLYGRAETAMSDGDLDVVAECLGEIREDFYCRDLLEARLLVARHTGRIPGDIAKRIVELHLSAIDKFRSARGHRSVEILARLGCARIAAGNLRAGVANIWDALTTSAGPEAHMLWAKTCLLTGSVRAAEASLMEAANRLDSRDLRFAEVGNILRILSEQTAAKRPSERILLVSGYDAMKSCYALAPSVRIETIPGFVGPGFRSALFRAIPFVPQL